MIVDKLKNTELPLVVRDTDGVALGQITVRISHNLTSASFTMTFQNEAKVLSSKDIIKDAFVTMQSFFEREMSSCGWDFLFEKEDQQEVVTSTPTE